MALLFENGLGMLVINMLRTVSRIGDYGARSKPACLIFMHPFSFTLYLHWSSIDLGESADTLIKVINSNHGA